ncbi:hypothetical protein MPF19_18205 [Polaribacter sp. Z014]|uniref:hypothetical protein n=1 Tax=Polaribacter sp. Z014 TaxID=2927126 RepID=UPI0020204EF1|nr:hypothetical protein [Polaribacter sp. Z014]MCL7765359.1 hypothetical protein [Polaribacter sp. Z014]
MKTVFTTQEGVKMNSELDFGSTANIKNEFHFLMTTYETQFDEEFDYFYRITDDGYIQLASSYCNDKLEIKTQYKLQFDTKKEDLIYVVHQLIEANHFYTGYPTLKDSVIFTQLEFDTIISDIKNPKIIEKAKATQKITPLITFLEQQQLHPKPTGFNENSWTANCPSGGNHFIQVVTTNDQWGCGYCKRKGGKEELEKWLQERKSIEDQKRLTTMVKELDKGSIQTKKTLKWWLKRY